MVAKHSMLCLVFIFYVDISKFNLDVTYSDYDTNEYGHTNGTFVAE